MVEEIYAKSFLTITIQSHITYLVFGLACQLNTVG